MKRPKGARLVRRLPPPRTAARTRARPVELRLPPQPELYDFAPVMWMILDPAGIILDVNPAACAVFGRARRFLIGMPFRMLTTPEGHSALLEHGRQCRTGAGVVETELELVTGTGTTMVVMLYSRGMVVDGQTMIPTIALDVTERAELERARWRAEKERDRAEKDRRLARASEAAKDRLLAMVSHELRNPLSPALIAASHILASPDIPDHIRHVASVIKRNIELEARLIDDLLDVARVTRGRLDLRVREVDVHQVLRHAAEACSTSARAKAVTIAFDLQAAHQVTLADEMRLRQVFWNLLNNAIKFSHPGGHVVVRSTSDESGLIIVSVRDAGVGIDASTLELLFSPFEQPTPSADHPKGLGLGLTIASGIVEAHGGRIWASSEGPGTGALFEVELATYDPPPPGKAVSARSTTGAKAGTGNGPSRVLVVEDNEDTGSLLSLLLAPHGYHVTLAHTVAEGRAALDDGPWDAVLSDIGLGDGSGLDIARHAQTLPSRPAALVALSGYGTQADIAASLDAGFDSHLVKPVDPDRLLELLQSVRR